MDSSINVHIIPRLGSRKVNSVTPIVVERFLDELETDGVGRGNQVNIFRVLKAILRDAYGKGAMADDPVKGVQEPEYVREKVVIPPLTSVKKALTAADEDLALEIVMMVGCGLRNGEARAVNINNVVADDVYRVHEQIHSNTHKPAKLKHRRAGEFREVPLPRSVREAMKRYEEKRGTTKEGYLLRGPSGYYTEPMERRRVQKFFKDLPAADGAGMYGFRHYFASNALGSGIPITDVAEWMGHKSIEETYPTYWRLMPGKLQTVRSARMGWLFGRGWAAVGAGVGATTAVRAGVTRRRGGGCRFRLSGRQVVRSSGRQVVRSSGVVCRAMSAAVAETSARTTKRWG
ncbi:tyrosine-type recombinase/integrase [Streptomyces sp. NPDC001758]